MFNAVDMASRVGRLETWQDTQKIEGIGNKSEETNIPPV
jgi:hypothetical protein